MVAGCGISQGGLFGYDSLLRYQSSRGLIGFRLAEDGASLLLVAQATDLWSARACPHYVFVRFSDLLKWT